MSKEQEKPLATTKRKSAKPITGRVVSLNSVVTGGNGKVSKNEAVKIANMGHPLVFMVGSKIYLVYNTDGSFAGKKLANFAHKSKVGIVGKVKRVKGVNVIIAEIIESME